MATAKDVLERAKQYEASGRDDKARRFYQAVIDRMPETQEAAYAKKRLDAMAKSAEVVFDLEALAGDSQAGPKKQPDDPAKAPRVKPSGKTKTCRHCGEVMVRGAKVCPRCGAKQKGRAKWIILGVVALFLIIGLAGGGGDGGSSSSKKSSASKSTASESGQTQAASTKPKKKAVATMDKYNKIQNNMSYAQVKAIMGFDGTEQGSSNVSAGGITMEVKIYDWEGEDLGANMTVSFQNDKVISKAQIGLK
ncbi:hypothetical protein [Pseudoramibacter faecis]|uniref:hypothetical protein n=1 Tax=Pseudoramibacter faecis TaxID=3108534 RepID=UPI002E77640D|nr:hypothetical protein [Pseudoramibacter sp. HA2172]